MQTPERDQDVNNAIRRELGMAELFVEAAANEDLGTGESLNSNNGFYEDLRQAFLTKKYRKADNS